MAEAVGGAVGRPAGGLSARHGRLVEAALARLLAAEAEAKAADAPAVLLPAVAGALLKAGPGLAAAAVGRAERHAYARLLAFALERFAPASPAASGLPAAARAKAAAKLLAALAAQVRSRAPSGGALRSGD